MTEAITYGMAKTGIHIKRANVGSVEAHNLRTEQYLAGLKKAGVNIYFFQELSHNNRSWVNPRYKGKTCEQLFKEMIEEYKAHHKKHQAPALKDRTMTNKKTGKEYIVAGWSPIREGVVPIKEDTKLSDFKPIEDRARNCNKSVSDYLRNVILGRTPRAAFTEEEREQLKVVSSLRFNLQQLNNYFHGHEWLRVKQENERIIILLKNLLKI